MMLPTDMALVWDKKFKPYVELYAKDDEKFFQVGQPCASLTLKILFVLSDVRRVKLIDDGISSHALQLHYICHQIQGVLAMPLIGKPGVTLTSKTCLEISMPQLLCCA